MGWTTDAAADTACPEDACVCSCRGLELDVQDAVEAARCCVRPRQRLLKFSEKTALAAYRALARCLENDCPAHGDEREWNEARTELVMRLGEAANA